MPEEFEFKNGANVDTRPEEAKIKDFFFSEVAISASPVNWIEKPESQWRKFPIQEQDGSGSCVAQTIKKLAHVLLWLRERATIDFSANDIYQRRSNKPGSGMIGVEAFDLWRTGGITLESLVPSQSMSDNRMDAAVIEKYKRDIGAVLKIGGHVGINEGDFETVASVIQQTGKAVMVWFYFTNAEWSPLYPRVIDQDLNRNNALRHSVSAVDYFLVNGKKYLLIEDSAHFGGLNRRLISEEFFRARNFFARYPMNFVFASELPSPTPPSEKPKFTFKNVLTFGMTNLDVKALQKILQYEGLFPANIALTGYYGAITAKAILAWQKKHAIAPLAELDSLQGRRVGEKTIKKLNELYS